MAEAFMPMIGKGKSTVTCQVHVKVRYMFLQIASFGSSNRLFKEQTVVLSVLIELLKPRINILHVTFG
jgi:hypothetical protein